MIHLSHPLKIVQRLRALSPIPATEAPAAWAPWLD